MAKEIALYKTKAQQVEVKRRVPLGIKKYVTSAYGETSKAEYKSAIDRRV